MFHSGKVFEEVSNSKSDRRDQVICLMRQIQSDIVGKINDRDATRLTEDSWTRPEGGGGTSIVLQDGEQFEKAGVNVSEVHGVLGPAAVSAMWGNGARELKSSGELSASDPVASERMLSLDQLLPAGTKLPDELPFFATGISTVIHPINPYVPTVHANFRYFEVRLDDTRSDLSADSVTIWWFGGGADLTPSYYFEGDRDHFHQVLRDVCNRHNATYYDRFSKWCDDYFYLPHRKETRGVGGLFFDRLRMPSYDACFRFVQDCGNNLCAAYFPIFDRRKDMDFGSEQVRWQRMRRSRYVEFNLLYDRGTTFGLKTNGRVESILISMPLHASWEYCHTPKPGSPEAKMQDVLVR